MNSESSDINNKIISKLQSIGRVEEKIRELASDDIFDDLSKHNDYFHSEHETESETLYDLRMQLSRIQDVLGEVLEILIVDGD